RGERLGARHAAIRGPVEEVIAPGHGRVVAVLVGCELEQVVEGADGGEDPATEEDLDGRSTMTITQLAEALGVRPSTRRFWEQEGLVAPVREGRLGARRYPARAIRQVRIVTVLRAAGFGIPATARPTAELRRSAGAEPLHSVLQTRGPAIRRGMELLPRRGPQLVVRREHLSGRQRPSAPRRPPRPGGWHPQSPVP